MQIFIVRSRNVVLWKRNAILAVSPLDKLPDVFCQLPCSFSTWHTAWGILSSGESASGRHSRDIGNLLFKMADDHQINRTWWCWSLMDGLVWAHTLHTHSIHYMQTRTCHQEIDIKSLRSLDDWSCLSAGIIKTFIVTLQWKFFKWCQKVGFLWIFDFNYWDILSDKTSESYKSILCFLFLVLSLPQNRFFQIATWLTNFPSD